MDTPLLATQLPQMQSMAATALGDLPGGSGAASDAGANELLRLAAAQRMNTDVRRAVFVCIMGSEDCMEAFEKLSRLPLKGEQDRELLRVLLHCCLQASGGCFIALRVIAKR